MQLLTNLNVIIILLLLMLFHMNNETSYKLEHYINSLYITIIDIAQFIPLFKFTRAIFYFNQLSYYILILKTRDVIRTVIFPKEFFCLSLYIFCLSLYIIGRMWCTVSTFVWKNLYKRIGFSGCGRDRLRFGWPSIPKKLRTKNYKKL
jgi:hypothetical protein